jgi:hypothetical protein
MDDLVRVTMKNVVKYDRYYELQETVINKFLNANGNVIDGLLRQFIKV